MVAVKVLIDILTEILIEVLVEIFEVEVSLVVYYLGSSIS